jgi:uncharacterized protein involved in exopolysaccharide biosynthesis
MSINTDSQPVAGYPPNPDSKEIEINLMYAVNHIIRGYRTVLLCALVGFILSVAIALRLPKTYTAEAVFLPPSSPESIASSSLILRQDPSDLYLGMLSSRTIAHSVIDQVHLKDVYHVKLYADARTQLDRQSKFSVNKNMLISISITTQDPKLSTDIANAYLDALYKLNGSMSASASAHRSQFFLEQLDHEREQLAQAEYDMQAVQEKTGMILPEGEAAAGLNATARLQAAEEDAETRLSTLLLSSTEENPQVQQLRTQIATLQGEIRRGQTSPSGSPGTGIPSGARLPGLMLDYARQSRELRERETLYNTLVQDYEKARLAALDPGPQLQIVDKAIMPEGKSGPPRTLIVLVSTFLAGVLGLIWVLFADTIRGALYWLRTVAAESSSR